MFSNIIIFFIILIILTLILHYSKDFKEGFFAFPDVDHNIYVAESKAKLNSLTNTVNLVNPALPVSTSSADELRAAIGGVGSNPTSKVYDLKPLINFELPSDMPPTIKQASSCESSGPTCNAFDNPTFSENCGMSFDQKSINTSGKPHIGGLYISPDDRKRQMAAAQSVIDTGSAPYDPYKVYQPTLGKAKPGTFALNKDQCVIVKEKVDCESKQTFNSPNCTQCYTSQQFSRVGPETQRLPATVYFVGNGTIYLGPQNRGEIYNWSPEDEAQINAGTSQKTVCNSVAGRGYQGNSAMIPQCGGGWCCQKVPFSLIDVKLDPTKPVTMQISPDAEGTTFNLSVQTTDGSMPYVAGYIEGKTPRGTFKLGLMSLINKDYVTNVRPKINGTVKVNGFKSLVFVPSVKNMVTISGMIPFSFLNVYNSDALTCDNGPIIAKAESATFLESDPCFGKANQPGNYKLECLQTRWVNLGGTQQGTGYPSDKTKADAIQKDTNGNPLTIDEIVDILAPKMISAQTGTESNGTPLSISDWNTVSMWATGKPINTPCDGPNSESGPLSKECLSYLYMNKGITSHIGSTYTLSPTSMASMKGQDTSNTYCQPGTPIDPSTPSGLKFGQKLGGINAAKKTYDQINRLANDNTLSNTARKEAVDQCYGVSLGTISTGKTTGPEQVFAVNGEGSWSYKYTRNQAQEICSKYGARVATASELDDAYRKGANWCFCGWMGDTNDSRYPNNTDAAVGCSGPNPGVKNCGDSSWAGGKAGVNCYGPKPGILNYPTNTILPFNKTSWDAPASATASQGPQGIFTVTTRPRVSHGHQLFFADTNLANQNMSWTHISAMVTSISLAPNGAMFATNSDDNIFYLINYKTQPTKGWMMIPGKLRQISTDGTNVVGTNSSNHAWTATVSQAIAGQWTRLPSVLTKIVTYQNKYYCLGLNQHIYYLTSPTSEWIMTLQSGVFKDIAMDDNVVLLIGTDGVLYYTDSQLYTPTGQYQQVQGQPAKFSSISLSKGSIYAIDTNGTPWYTSNYKNTNWVQVPGGNQRDASHRVTKP